MVKLEDGSLVFADQLLAGEGQDDNGDSLKFKEVKTASVPTYTAESNMGDGSGRKKTYSFGFANTQVKVAVVITEPGERKISEQEQEPKPKEEEEPGKKSSSAAPATEARVIKTEPPNASPISSSSPKHKSVKLNGRL